VRRHLAVLGEINSGHRKARPHQEGQPSEGVLPDPDATWFPKGFGFQMVSVSNGFGTGLLPW
jgi:hypothetical protein